MTLSTSTVTLAPGSSRTYSLAPGEAVTVATEPNCYVTVTETPDVISSADLDGQTNVRTSILQYKGEWTYGPYALGGTVAVAVSLSKSTSSVSVTLGSTVAAVVGAAGLSYDKLYQLFGDDEMIIGTYVNRPLATTVAAGKEFMATDLGNMRWVSDGTQWILLKPSQIAGDATQQSIVDSVGQGTTESTLYTLNLPANALGEDDGLLIDIIWSCSNSSAAKRIRARFGGTVLFNVDLTTHLVYRQSVKLRNRNSRSAQVAQGNSTTIFGPIGSVDVQTFTVDFTAAQALTITGQFPVAGTSANDLTLEEVTINAV